MTEGKAEGIETGDLSGNSTTGSNTRAIRVKVGESEYII